MEFQQADPEKLNQFKRLVPVRMREAPFYYFPKPDEQYVSNVDRICYNNQYVIIFKLVRLQGSAFSPFLHDAIYLYALALNKTLRNGGDLKNGTTIMENSKQMLFEGS